MITLGTYKNFRTAQVAIIGTLQNDQFIIISITSCWKAKQKLYYNNFFTL